MHLDQGPYAESGFEWGFVAMDEAAVFVADDGVAGPQLWRTDGTEAGTVRIAVIGPPGRPVLYSSLTYLRGNLFFEADSGVAGRELWTSDGTPEGTRSLGIVTDGNPPVAIGRSLIFGAFDQELGLEPHALTPLMETPTTTGGATSPTSAD